MRLISGDRIEDSSDLWEIPSSPVPSYSNPLCCLVGFLEIDGQD
jgi:hypothetical protein